MINFTDQKFIICYNDLIYVRIPISSHGTLYYRNIKTI